MMTDARTETVRPPSSREEQAPIHAVRARAYTIPTDEPEADGTLDWNATTVIVVEIDAGGKTGLGYTYTDASAARLIQDTLAAGLVGRDAMDIEGLWQDLYRRVRNLGRAGIASTAISAIDGALWDVKALLLDMPLARLLGAVRDRVRVYGSGGFTTYSDGRMREQLRMWKDQGCRWVKIKVGRDPERDLDRIRIARRAIGEAGLFVDANGAFHAKAALHYARRYAEQGVAWFEEPVSTEDTDGLRMLKQQGPAGMDIAAGEYGYTAADFRRLLQADAVDVLQADASRCGGITGFLKTAALCEALQVPLSAHCAPALHLHAACAVQPLIHQEWFHDHVRIEAMLFDGAPRVRDGTIAPDWSRPGCGLAFKRLDAARYAVS